MGIKKDNSHTLSEIMISNLNVLNAPLAKCDRSEITGFQGSSFCAPNGNDLGSHYICLDLESAEDLESGLTYAPFWTKTGQAKSSYDAATAWPLPGPWCVSMKAYRVYSRLKHNYMN